jgi:SMODS and SLOG-associating 2TM effector domain 1/Protein of unknown function (DUF4231)
MDCETPVLENAWDEYRGWAKRARDQQAGGRAWDRMAAATAGLAAVFGAAAGVAAIGDASKWLAFLAAACAAITPVLGQDMLSVGRAGAWLTARATAEEIKSECFRYAARSSEYVGDNRKALFRQRWRSVAEAAFKTGLIPLADPAKDDARRPNEDMTLDWYLKNRLAEQQIYYARTQVNSEKSAARLRALSLALALAAALLGAASATFGLVGLSPWIGVAGTLGGILVARGLRDRSQFLAASSAAMVSALGRLKETATEENALLPNFVDAVEDLLASEHAAWSERMRQLTASVAAPAAASGQGAQQPAGSADTEVGH